MAKKTQTATKRTTNNANKLNKPPSKQCVKQQAKIEKQEKQIANLLKNLK